MIITLTPNPSVDRTVAVSSLDRGSVMRAFETREDPGGKGLNVSRALALHGTPTTAVLPIGGVYGRLMLDLLEPLDVGLKPVRISQAIRANIAIVEPDGTTTKINELGPRLTDDELEGLRTAVREASAGAAWMVCCGSLPPGISDGFYVGLIHSCHAAGLKVAVDSSGGPLTAALAAAPDLIKPNRIELAEAVGHELPTVGAVIAAARILIADGIGTLVVSLGRDGALLVNATEAIQATARVAQPLSTVGAGDALLAGYLHAVSTGMDTATALRTAVAFGAAAVALPGSEMPGPEQVAAVSVQVTVDPDPDRPLDD